MWRRKPKPVEAAPEPDPPALREALREARIEAAERTGVVVDLRDAELARLETLNESLDTLFGEIPTEADLFDRGISRGDTPRLWIDCVAHVAMAKDKRHYRFVQDTRFGRKVLAETAQADQIVAAVTRYVANRLIERERALAVDASPTPDETLRAVRRERRVRRWRTLKVFAMGVAVGALALCAVLWAAAVRHL